MSAVYLPYTHGCFACGASNLHGLQLRFRAEQNEIHADFHPKPHHAGYTGILHGGVVAAALDEAMFWAASFPKKQFHISVEVSVRYLKKVDVSGHYILVARLVREQRKICFTEAELRDASRAPLATATGKFFPMRDEDVPLNAGDFYPDPKVIAPSEFFSTHRKV